MKTIAKLTLCLFLAGAVSNSFAQQKSSSTTKDTKKKSKKEKTGIDNKIAVSDQAQPKEKSNSKKKDNGGISNK